MRTPLRVLTVAVPACLVAATLAVPMASAAPGGPNAVADAAALQATLDAAAAKPNGGTIVLGRQATITVSEPLTYAGSGSLTIQGGGATIIAADGDTVFNLIESTGGAAITLRDLTLTGSRDAGMLVSVPEGATGDQSVTLDKVTVSGNARNGVYIDDCDGFQPPLQCDPEDNNDGSDAGVVLTLNNSTIAENGFGDTTDMDGIRIDERGNGSVRVFMVQSTVEGNAADGIEVDESDEGGVDLKVRASRFIDNGEEPNSIDPLDEEAYDPEDAFDIDERGNGSVTTDLEEVLASGNYDENFDFNEDGDGGIVARLVSATITDALGGRGYDLEEFGEGSVTATLDRVAISGSDSDGMRVNEDAIGDLTLTVASSSFTNNSGDGMDLRQVSPGAGAATVSDSTFSGNGGKGIKKSGVTVTEINNTPASNT